MHDTDRVALHPRLDHGVKQRRFARPLLAAYQGDVRDSDLLGVDVERYLQHVIFNRHPRRAVIQLVQPDRETRPLTAHRVDVPADPREPTTNASFPFTGT
ncbi:leucyl aminopeptidase, putative [Babesia caballi]|uniref:Leucyl aminopeptidase, putative n=1 Tax=Babesia caballi TaxID=5871 RepID=A0AAV4LXV9_BABCB|nr:leucyl aminopeptidase, putative [Babesia caballi]